VALPALIAITRSVSIKKRNILIFASLQLRLIKLIIIHQNKPDSKNLNFESGSYSLYFPRPTKYDNVTKRVETASITVDTALISGVIPIRTIP